MEYDTLYVYIPIMQSDYTLPTIGISSLRFKITVFSSVLISICGSIYFFISLYEESLLSQRNWPWEFPFTLSNLVLAVLVFISFLLTLWYLDRLLKPLDDTVLLALRLSRGDFYARAEVVTESEIGLLAKSLNALGDKIVTQIEELEHAGQLKQEFISISSHNLQTPLIVIKGYLELLRKHELHLDDQQLRALEAIDRQIHQLQTIVKRLIDINQLQGELIMLHKHPTDFANFSDVIAKDFIHFAKMQGISMDVQILEHPLPAVFDREWIKMVWQNLIDNAIKYTPKGGSIVVSVGKNSKGVIYGEVSDTGIGIAETEQESVFLPFHRSQDVLDMKYAGFGLGLYAVKLVIDRHQGTIFLTSQEGNGTTIRFSIPG